MFRGGPEVSTSGLSCQTASDATCCTMISIQEVGVRHWHCCIEAHWISDITLHNDFVQIGIGRRHCRIEADWSSLRCPPTSSLRCERSCIVHREFPTTSPVQTSIFRDSIKTTVLALRISIRIASGLKLSLANVFPLTTLPERAECWFILVLGQNAVVITLAITARSQ